jgi:hypothetical protein
MLAPGPEERLRQNDRMLRTILLLRQRTSSDPKDKLHLPVLEACVELRNIAKIRERKENGFEVSLEYFRSIAAYISLLYVQGRSWVRPTPCLLQRRYGGLPSKDHIHSGQNELQFRLGQFPHPHS